MIDARESSIRETLLEWREAIIARIGITPGHQDYCARNSYVLHDIFIDAIAKNAHSIRNLDDLRHVAYYWKWIDEYGSEIYSLISNHLVAPKRSFNEESSSKRLCCR